MGKKKFNGFEILSIWSKRLNLIRSHYRSMQIQVES